MVYEDFPDAPLGEFNGDLVKMSAVRIAKIKLQNELAGTGPALLGKPDLHLRKNTLYLPAPGSGKILRIDTENDRLIESITDPNWVSSVIVSQDRDFIFAISVDRRTITTFKAGIADGLFSLNTDIYPEDVAFDSDRDLLLVRGTVDPPPSHDRALDMYRFPESKHIGRVELRGNPVSAQYDGLEDEFVILGNNPSELNILKNTGREKLTALETVPLPNSEPTCLALCPSSRKIAVGTSDGRIMLVSRGKGSSSIIAGFRDPISKLVYNPLLEHLYVTFQGSRNLSILDMESGKIRESVKCSSDVSSLVFDEMHNKFYVFTVKNTAVEVYLEQGR